MLRSIVFLIFEQHWSRASLRSGHISCFAWDFSLEKWWHNQFFVARIRQCLKLLQKIQSRMAVMFCIINELLLSMLTYFKIFAFSNLSSWASSLQHFNYFHLRFLFSQQSQVKSSSPHEGALGIHCNQTVMEVFFSAATKGLLKTWSFSRVQQ